MMQRVLILLVVLTGLGVGRTGAATTSPRPNILVLLADDLGYADVGFAGAKQIKTPNLDRLAAAGARLDDYYVQPLCSPTRAAFLTGRYPMRYGLQQGVLLPYEKRGLPVEEQLLPQALQAAGYSTAIVGKWHLGHNEPQYLPLARGFGHHYGHYNGEIDYFKHERMGGFDWHRDGRESRDEGYSTHLLAKEAVRLIQGYSAAQPFFLYVPFNGVHAPFQAPESYKKPYADLPEPRRTYAGMVAAVDEAVGQIIAALEQQGLAGNTLIVFSSDNGGPAPGRITDNSPFRGGKGGVYEGGTRVCAFVNWREHITPGTVIRTPLHAVDWYPTLLKLAGVDTRPTHPLDGRDIWPVLAEGKTIESREILLNTNPNAGAIRVGDWKLVVKTGAGNAEDSEDAPTPKAKKGKAAGRATEELFNLAADPGEKRDLSKENPAKRRELRERYDSYARQAIAPTNQARPADFQVPRVWGER
jgi:arylsulfatase A-like enzyme